MYPNLADIRTLEKHTLQRITQIGEFGRLGALQAAAAAAAPSINEYRGGVNIHLGFTLDIRLRGDRSKTKYQRRVDVGALVEATSDNRAIKNASYSVAICRNATPATSPIVRKFHFDYEPLAYRHASEPKPSVHMQYCGKLSRHHLAAGYKQTRLLPLYPHFEKPRLPLPPTSVALLLNWLLLEFQSDPASQPILRTPAWRKLVAHAERVVLVPYFKTASEFLISAGNAERGFAHTHLYELDV